MVSNITSVLIPFYHQTRAVVGLPDGGLANPMPLLFDPTLGQKPINSTHGNFSYPQLSNVTRPSNDVDLAYMTVGALSLVAHAEHVCCCRAHVQAGHAATTANVS